MDVFLAWRLIKAKKIISACVYLMSEADFKVIPAPREMY